MNLQTGIKILLRDVVDLLMFSACIGLFIWYTITGINLSSFIIFIVFYIFFVMVRFYTYANQRNKLYQRLKDNHINADDIMFGK